MGKQWEVKFSELKQEPSINKLYDEGKFTELYEILAEVKEKFPDNSTVGTATRTIVEETMNIINFNTDWRVGVLKVRSDFSSGTVNLEIIYSGTTYWDPKTNNTTTVVGSIDVFDSYIRSHEIKNGTVHITIKIKLK